MTQPTERTFKLPEMLRLEIQGCKLELLLGIGKAAEEDVTALEERLGVSLPPARVSTDIQLPLGMPEPDFPPMPTERTPTPHEYARRDYFSQLNMSQQMVGMMMQLRHHQMAAAAPDNQDLEPGEEWKQPASEDDVESLRFTDAENRLYEAALNKLTSFIEEGPPSPPGDPPVI